MGQIAFLRDHLDDVASDMSVFHRIDDITELDGPTLWRLAWRLPHYRGCMRHVVESLQSDDAAPARPQQPSQPSRVVQGTVTALRSHSEFTAAAGEFGAPIFEITEVKAT